MLARLRRLVTSAIIAAGLLAAPFDNPPTPLALMGIGPTPAHAQWQSAACRAVWVAGRWVYRCARTAGPRVWSWWSHPRTQAGVFTGLGVGVPSYLLGNRPRSAHAPGYHAPGSYYQYRYSGPRLSPYQANWLRYHAYRQQQLGRRYGPVQMPGARYHSMGAYRSPYGGASTGHSGGGVFYDPPR
jgi:hypothetical protein